MGLNNCLLYRDTVKINFYSCIFDSIHGKYWEVETQSPCLIWKLLELYLLTLMKTQSTICSTCPQPNRNWRVIFTATQLSTCKEHLTDFPTQFPLVYLKTQSFDTKWQLTIHVYLSLTSSFTYLCETQSVFDTSFHQDWEKAGLSNPNNFCKRPDETTVVRMIQRVEYLLKVRRDSVYWNQ